MPAYTFESLSPFDFELLSRDLVQRHIGVPLETFKPGRDNGIDFRGQLPSGKGTVIGQAKHFVRSGYGKLMEHLLKEVDKVDALSPERYIVTTSVPLSPANKHAIVEAFDPHIRSAGDVLGQDDLNNLLRDYPEIERRNFKLWFTSTAILDQIANRSVFERSALVLEDVLQRARLYVSNPSQERALELLSKHRFCVISGPPAIGKTTLAGILLLIHIRLGYEVIAVSGDIEEAFRALNRESKQIFYYDDFLGSIGAGEALPRNEAKRLAAFVRGLGSSVHTRLLLTTREYILNQASARSEDLKWLDLDSRKCVLELNDYSRAIRAEILYNHLYYYGVDTKAIESLIKDYSYRKIIEHRNFSPRIVEWMTKDVSATSVEHSSYSHVFLAALDNPASVWDIAFNEHLSADARTLLLVLSTFRREVWGQALADSFHSIQTQSSADMRLGAFMRAVRELDGTFIRTRHLDSDSSQLAIRFYNPSLREYVLDKIWETPNVARDLILRATHLEQLQSLLGTQSRNGRIGLFDFSDKRLNEDISLVLSRLLELPNNSIVRYQVGGSVFDKIIPMSVHEKLRLAIEIARTLMPTHSTPILERCAELLVEYMRDNASESASSLVWTVRSLDAIGLLPQERHNELLESSKRWLIDRSLRDAESAIQLFDFWKRFPDVFHEEEVALIPQYFAQNIGDVVAGAPDWSVDDLEAFISDARELSEEFNLDVENSVALLQETLDEELESIAGNEDDEYEQYRESMRTAENDYSDIDRLFESLINRLE